jgi:hypothetical protein
MNYARLNDADRTVAAMDVLAPSRPPLAGREGWRPALIRCHISIIACGFRVNAVLCWVMDLLLFMHMRTHDNSEKQRETANIAAVFSRAVAAEREDFCGEDITGG